jgi:phage terminase large subunit GpA-like protein
VGVVPTTHRMVIDGIEYSEEEVAQAAELYPALWVLQHEIKNENGMPIEFTNHKFLVDIYNDLSPLQVVLKPPQVGMTVCETLKSFYVAKKLNKQIIYTLPTETDMQAMVGVTINRLVAQNPILRSWVKDHDTVSQKTVGDSIINYRGTWSTKQAMMIPSDLNIHDEVDASDAQVIVQYENRLQAKADGMRWYFSHPSIAGFGVDIYWQLSDKREWVIICPLCT